MRVRFACLWLAAALSAAAQAGMPRPVETDAQREERQSLPQSEASGFHESLPLRDRRRRRTAAETAVMGQRELSAPDKTAAPAKVEWRNGHRLVAVAPGEYKVGAAAHPTNPPRTAKLAAYFIADAETTNAQFAKFVDARGYRTDAERRGSAHIFRYGEAEWKWIDTPGASWRRPRGLSGPEAVKELSTHPVTCVSAADAAAYCSWAGGRLPSQAEWEVAARAGSTEKYPWGAQFKTDGANIWNGVTHVKNSMEDGWEFTAPVRSFPPNAWGLYDVIGNVFEFVSDLPPGTKQKPDQPLTSARGGSWWCSHHTCKAFNLVDNGTMPLHGSLPNQGFRLAVTAGDKR